MSETLQAIAFVVFSALTLVPALLMVTARNLFHGALYLLLSLFGVAGLFVLLVAPFLAAVQVLVYMGAIGILIIFGVMLTRGMMRLDHIYNNQQGLAIGVALGLFVALILMLTPLVDELGLEGLQDLNADFTASAEAPEVNYETVREFGRVIADQNGYVLPFEVASILLTAAMIGAIVVAREDEA
jgi:NADH-quinone oxidoreductase subunit J